MSILVKDTKTLKSKKGDWRKEIDMGVQEMVGSMGLTLFCNKCVELLHRFRQDGTITPEFSKTCKQAISAFGSLKWPNGGPDVYNEKVALFNTNEEVKSFEQVLARESQEEDETAFLNKWISKLETVLDDEVSVEKRKQEAYELQKFFDVLGDCSFYTTRESLSSLETMAGI